MPILIPIVTHLCAFVVGGLCGLWGAAKILDKNGYKVTEVPGKEPKLKVVRKKKTELQHV